LKENNTIVIKLYFSQFDIDWFSESVEE
jgi:hypothetical protein